MHGAGHVGGAGEADHDSPGRIASTWSEDPLTSGVDIRVDKEVGRPRRPRQDSNLRHRLRRPVCFVEAVFTVQPMVLNKPSGPGCSSASRR